MSHFYEYTKLYYEKKIYTYTLYMLCNMNNEYMKLCIKKRIKDFKFRFLFICFMSCYYGRYKNFLYIVEFLNFFSFLCILHRKYSLFNLEIMCVQIYKKKNIAVSFIYKNALLFVAVVVISM